MPNNGLHPVRMPSVSLWKYYLLLIMSAVMRSTRTVSPAAQRIHVIHPENSFINTEVALRLDSFNGSKILRSSLLFRWLHG